MNDVLAQLADANPVHADELAPLELHALVRRRPSRRLVLATAVLAAALAATLIGVFAFGGSHTGSPPTSRQGPTGPTGPEMLRHPLGGYANKEVTLAEAAAAIGEPVVLPDTSLVGPADVGAVWGNTGPDWARYHPTEGNVAVTFPAQRVIVSYQLPGLGSASGYTSDAKQIPGAAVIELSGTPALAMPQDPAKQQFGVIVFRVGGLGIQVLGPYDEATLETIAQSILDRYQAQPPQQSAGIGPVDWARPPAGKRVDSIAAAAASLAFAPARLRTRALGSPTIFVGGPSGELTLVYDHAADARIWRRETYRVIERPARSTTTGVLRAIARACVARGGCDASARMIALRGGRDGLLLTGTTTTEVIWVEGGIYFDVLGPSNRFNGPVALSVANWVILAEKR
jgi:hypothetical protein